MESVKPPNCLIRADMTVARKNEPNMFFNTYSLRIMVYKSINRHTDHGELIHHISVGIRV